MNVFQSACLLLLILCPRVHAQEDPIAELKEIYHVRMTQAINLHADQMAALADQYSSALEASAANLQRQGNLDGLLAVNTEIQRFKRTGKVPDQSPQKTHESVIKLQDIYRKSKSKSDDTKGKTTVELTEKYLAYLEGMQKELTKDGKLEQAIKVKAEAERARKLQAGMPAWEPEKNPKPGLIAGGSLPLVTWNKSRPRDLGVGLRLNHQQGNEFAKDDGIRLTGGRTTIEGLNSKLLEACRKSNALSLIVHFETDSLKQAGPARIFSFSENGTQRNFSLCQENDQLILRLRTTKTGDNGTNPEVKLGRIEQGKLHRVAITYEPGKLAFHMDGKTLPVQQIGGDFSNWKEYQVVLGNEWKDDRSWKGSISGFALYSSALDEREAIALTR